MLGTHAAARHHQLQCIVAKTEAETRNTKLEARFAWAAFSAVPNMFFLFSFVTFTSVGRSVVQRGSYRAVTCSTRDLRDSESGGDATQQ